MRRLMGFVATLAAALAAVVMVPSPALAAASFTWTFSGDYGIYSRDFYQPRERDIYVKVNNFSPCTRNGDRVTLYFYLYKNDTFNNQVGNVKQIDCTGTVKWSLVNPGTYYWRMLIEGQHREMGTNFTANGVTYYDGATP
jgi:hypothetical protein